jgi:proteic killer suppression protein
MDFCFKSKKLRKECENYRELCRKYGEKRAKKIMQRIKEISAAMNLYDISMNPNARLKPLKHNRKGQLSIDINHPYRIILKPLKGNIHEFKTITRVQIIEIVDYH